MTNADLIAKELRGILGHDETFQAADVVDFAKKNKRSAIRREFDKRDLFNDKTAAQQARLAFARQIIQRVRVRIIRPKHPPAPIRVYVNLTKERKTPDQGYRMRKEVLADTARQQQFREEVSRDIEAIATRYADILTDSQIAQLRQVAWEVSHRLATKRATIGD